jgi:hypothetical protein
MSRHEKLLQQYADELRTAKHFAEQWWAYLQAVERQKMGSQEIADRVLRRRWPDGPASHPRVLAVVRKYWLLCEDLNQAIEAQTQHREAAEPRFRLAPNFSFVNKYPKLIGRSAFIFQLHILLWP